MTRTLATLIGSQLRWLRIESGLTQAEIARRTGMHRPIVSRLELGTRPGRGVAADVRLETIYRYAAALGVDPVLDVLCVLDNYEIGSDADAEPMGDA